MGRGGAEEFKDVGTIWLIKLSHYLDEISIDESLASLLASAHVPPPTGHVVFTVSSRGHSRVSSRDALSE